MSIPPSVRAYVLRRDGYRCMAPYLDGKAGWCRDTWGNQITPGRWTNRDPGPEFLQMSHVKDANRLALGKKAENHPDHLIALCPFHHTGTEAGSNWEARNRGRIRAYLKSYGPSEEASDD